MSATPGVQGTNKLGAVLAKMTVKDLCDAKRGREMVTLTAEHTVAEALGVLAREEVLSAPVMKQDENLTTTWLGWFDVLDVVFLALRAFSDGKTDGELPYASWCRDLEQLKARDVEFGARRLADVMTEEKRTAWHPVLPSTPLSEVVDKNFSRGVHRVPVVNGMGMVVNVVTQSDLIKLVIEHLDDAGEAAVQSVRTLHLSSPAVITMSSEALAIHAYFLMMFNQVSAVGIVDRSGALVGNLSASDIRGLSQQNLASLLKTCREFVGRVRFKPQPPLAVTADASLERVLMQLSLYQVHRIWIVDANGKPTAVCSLTDVCKWLMKICPHF